MKTKDEHYNYFEIIGAGFLRISKNNSWQCGYITGFEIGVDWGRHNYAGGVLSKEDAIKLANQILSACSDTPRLFPHPTCPDCNGSGDLDDSACPCLSPDPHESVCPKCGSVMGMMCPGEYRCFKC